MSVEQELEADEADVEAEAARVVELEEDIREAREEVEDDEVDAVVDATLSSTASRAAGRVRDWARANVHEADVVSAESLGRNVRIRFEADGEIHDSTVPFPRDPTDGTEPLVRLCRREDVKPERVGDLDSVPVVEGWRGYDIVLPPARDTRQLRVKLPGGFEVTPEVETIDSRLDRYVERWQYVLLRTPLIGGKPGDMNSGELRAVLPMMVGLMVALIGGIAVGANAGLLPGMLTGAASLLLGFGTFVAVAKAEFGDGPETC